MYYIFMYCYIFYIQFGFVKIVVQCCNIWISEQCCMYILSINTWTGVRGNHHNHHYSSLHNHHYLQKHNESTIVSEGFEGGTRGAPIMPRDEVSRTAHVGT